LIEFEAFSGSFCKKNTGGNIQQDKGMSLGIASISCSKLEQQLL